MKQPVKKLLNYWCGKWKIIVDSEKNSVEYIYDTIDSLKDSCTVLIF
jgi:hypothetical protein